MTGPASARPPGAAAPEPERRLRVAVLGSTGSVGRSVLRVIARHQERFEVAVLAAHRSVGALARQAERHASAHVVLSGARASGERGRIPRGWARGRNGLVESAGRSDVDVVVNAVVGFAGLEPSLRALEAGKRLALANKESLVAGGELVTRAIRRPGQLVPIDSEHSGVLQCLAGHPEGTVQRIVLTASGGPFRGWSPDRLAGVRPDDALRHPTWEMGRKITIDSATLANKALEVMEAHFLYGLPYDRIEAVVHPQSVVHSLVEFVDGSVIAQLGFPTMELPILYALTHPGRAPDAALRTFDPVKSSPLTFESIDLDAFPHFRIGSEAGEAGGAAPAVYNAANEVAVAAFLAGEVSFPRMAGVVEETLDAAGGRAAATLGDVLEADREAREIARRKAARSRPAGRTRR